MSDEARLDPPRLDQLNLVVRDMEATVAFYRLLGVAIPEADSRWADHHRNATTPDGIALDFDAIAFAQRWDAAWPDGVGTVITFRVATREAVDAKFAELTSAGYAVCNAPYDAFWGARFAIVEDPDGRHVGIMSPSDDAHRGAVPEPPP